MKKVTAYQCEFCKQLFEFDLRYAYHEKDCSKNPGSRSCETCAFFRLENYQFGLHDWFTFGACIKNKDLSVERQANCIAYKNRTEIEDNEFYLSLNSYNRNEALRKAALLAVKFDPEYYGWCIEGFDFDAVEDGEYITSKDDMSSERFD